MTSRCLEIQQIDVMPIWHCVDQHVWTGVAYFAPFSLVKQVHEDSTEPTSTPFLTLFSRLFKEITGFNPRRNESLYRPLGYKDKGHNKVQRKLVWDENDPFVLEMRRAQHLYLMAKQLPQVERGSVGGSSYVFEYVLDVSWLAGLVGAIEIPGTPPVLVTLNANSPLELTAIRRPARQMKEEGLTPQREEAAKEMARAKLRGGLPLDKAHAPSSFLVGAKVYLRTGDDGQDYYVVKKGSTEKSWDEARKIRLELPYHSEMVKTVENALLNTGTGIESGAWEALDELYLNTDDSIIRRVLYYISTFKTTFELNRISRDGGGTIQAVAVEDVGAYQFMLDLSLLFPAALRPDAYKPQFFTSPVGPLLWNVRDIIKAKLFESEEHEGWDVEMEDSQKRTPWEHQTSSLQEMIDNHERGIRGNFLLLDVGMGKTWIVLSYIKYLLDHEQLPDYIIYSLPSSAIESVSEEILAFGLSINLMIPLKTKKKVKVPKGVTISYDKTPEKGVVNLIEHDHLKLVQEEFSEAAGNSLIIFDEVHKMLADTQRTSAALQISRLSKEFVVLTGTPVIDNKIYRLIPWLEQIVAFEVNEKNFWASAAVMVSRQASTGIKTEHEYPEANFTSAETLKYKKLAPVAMGGENSMPRMEEIREATEISYIACDREIVRQVMILLGENNGVMVVASTAEHQEKLKSMLVKAGVRDKDIFILTGKQSIFLTDDAVAKKKVPAYKVVITTIRQSAGYTLTVLNSFVSGIYPSNQATRSQLEGRINRLGSKHKLLRYIYVHAGVLTYILEHHDQARSLELAIRSMGVQIKQ